MSEQLERVKRSRIEQFMENAQALAVMLEKEDEERESVLGYARYLLGTKPRSYAALALFLAMFGRKYLLPEIQRMFQGRRWDIIYELGPGTGWLINSLTPYAPNLYTLDKRTSLYQRAAGVMFMEWDLEGRSQFHQQETPDSPTALIIANQFLHCVDNWKDIVKRNRAEWLVIEVTNQVWMHQLAAFGAKPIEPREMKEAFHEADYVLKERAVMPMLEMTYWRPL